MEMNYLLKTILIFSILMVYSVNKLFSQNYIEDLNDYFYEDDEVYLKILENNYEELQEIINNPININSATKEELEKLPFLSDKIIENILYYVYKYGPLKTYKELMLIEDINRRVYKYMMPFICIKDTDNKEYRFSFKDVLKYGKSELLTRVDIPLYTKKGYTNYTKEEISNNPNCRYLGYRYFHNFRYSYRYKNNFIIGLTAESDAGEPFFSNPNTKGYDYYSPYLFIRDYNKINRLVIGNYRASYGYGLVINLNSYFGKNSMIYNLNYSFNGLNKHSSTNEYDFLTGVGISYNLFKNVDIDAFCSYRKMDGIVDNMFITSIKGDGFHRLKRDFLKKNCFTNKLVGSHLCYNSKYSKFGVTAVYNVFNNMLKSRSNYYNLYYPKGKMFYNIGVDYKLFLGKFTVYGETAVDKNMNISTINFVDYNITNNTSISVMNRYYDYRYQSLYAQSISEIGRVQNETAFCIGLKTSAINNFDIKCYCDIFYFPWKKYLVNKSGTNGIDAFIYLCYSPSYELDMLIKYRYKNREKNYSKESSSTKVISYNEHKLSCQLNYGLSDGFTSKTLLIGTAYNYKSEPFSTGLLISESIMYKFKSIPLRVDLTASWFNTDDYFTRISFYEKDVLYAFSLPSLFYKGYRGAFNISFSPLRNLTFYTKFSSTLYTNRETIGTGLEEINSNHKSDIHLLLRYKF